MSKIRKQSMKQEREVAALLGGQTLPASGATRHGGADVRRQGVLTAECKFTYKKSYSLKLEEVQKVRIAAIRKGERALMHIRFLDRAGRPYEDLIVLPAADYSEMAAKAEAFDINRKLESKDL